MRKPRKVLSLVVRASLTVTLLACTVPMTSIAQDQWPTSKSGEVAPKAKGMPSELAKNLANFDDLDFRVYTGQQWQDLHKSHSQDVVVHYPDGHISKGIDKHIEEMKFLWTFAPDNRITEHAVRFGTADAEWTAVMGFLDGTFAKPMILPDGTTIPPTGKAYHLPMATLGHWDKQGIMYEEYLFWDNAELMKQMGLAK